MYTHETHFTPWIRLRFVKWKNLFPFSFQDNLIDDNSQYNIWLPHKSLPQIHQIHLVHKKFHQQREMREENK